MKRYAHGFGCTIVIFMVALITGCTTTSQEGLATQAQAQAGAPTAAQVEVLSLPYDGNLPTYVVAVDPLDYSASGQISGGGAHAQTTDIGKGLSAQLMTALSKWPNISMIDREMLTKNPDGTFVCKLGPNELGPFIIKGTVTEFNETAGASEKTRGASLGRVGLIAGIAGAITGEDELTYVGAGLAAANPTFAKGKANRCGMVGMDLQLVDGRSGRILNSFNCSGTFTTVSEINGRSIFGIGGTNAEFAASALGQATRAAMNDALKRTADTLKSAR